MPDWRCRQENPCRYLHRRRIFPRHLREMQ